MSRIITLSDARSRYVKAARGMERRYGLGTSIGDYQWLIGELSAGVDPGIRAEFVASPRGPITAESEIPCIWLDELWDRIMTPSWAQVFNLDPDETEFFDEVLTLWRHGEPIGDDMVDVIKRLCLGGPIRNV